MLPGRRQVPGTQKARPVNRVGCGPQLGASKTASNEAQQKTQMVGRSARELWGAAEGWEPCGG